MSTLNQIKVEDEIYDLEDTHARNRLNEILQEAKDYTDNEIATFDFIKIVPELPEQGLVNRTYLVTKKENATEKDLYDEYLWVNNGTEEEPSWDWEYQGTKTIEVDLAECVKFDDYANSTTAGVCKVNTNNGVGINVQGVLYIARASDTEINNKTNTFKPIVPSSVDYAVKSGLSNSKLTWTETERQNARNLLGVTNLIASLETNTNTKISNINTSMNTRINAINNQIGDIETLLGGI